jgi:hypothetical protein
MRAHVSGRAGGQARALVAVGAAVLAVTGCVGRGGNVGDRTGSSEGSSGLEAGRAEPLKGVVAAAARMLSRRARVSFRLDGAQVFGSTRAPVFGIGVFDFASGLGSEVIDLPEVGRQEPGIERVIFVQTRVYLQPKGTSTVALPHDKAWMSASLTGSESVSTNFPQFIGQIQGLNPLLLLQEVAWGARAATPIEERSRRAPEARGHRVTIDLARALAATGKAGATVSSLAIQQQLSALGSGRSASVSVFVWIDRTGRIAQLRASIPGAGLGTELLTLEDVKNSVRVVAPPAAQVVDITALTPSGERENNGGGDSDGG